MELQKIDHINIVVTDLDESCAFFRDLGFSVSNVHHLEGDWIEQVVGLQNVIAKFVALSIPGAPVEQTVIELIEYQQPKGANDPAASQPNQLGFRHMALRVKNIEEWRKKLNKKCVQLFSDVQRPQGLGGKYATKQLFYFLGPDGIILELMEYDEK